MRAESFLWYDACCCEHIVWFCVLMLHMLHVPGAPLPPSYQHAGVHHAHHSAHLRGVHRHHLRLCGAWHVRVCRATCVRVVSSLFGKRHVVCWWSALCVGTFWRMWLGTTTWRSNLMKGRSTPCVLSCQLCMRSFNSPSATTGACVGTHCVVPQCNIGEADRQDAVSCRNSIVYPNVDSTYRVYSLFFCVYVPSGSGVSVTF